MPRHLKPTIALAVLVVSATALARPANARVVLHQTYGSFAVSGHTAAELDRELAERGPKTSNMTRHPGATQIAFSGKLSYQKTSNSCRISRAEVDLTVKIIMPRWVNRRHSTPELAFIWDTLSSDIRRHEERHAEIALQHARALDQALSALSPEATCQAMEAEATQVTDREIAAHDEDQRRFDRVEAINFEARMTRLLRYRAEEAKGR